MEESLVDEKAEPHTALRPVGPSAFDDFFRREYVAMVSLAAAITGSRWEGEDLAQVALTRAHHDWSRVSQYENPGTWVRRVTINLALSARRRRSVAARATLRLVPPETAPSADSVSGDPELWAAVASLPRQQRAAIALHYLEDRSVAEIAELMGCSASTARVHLHRGRNAIARALEVQS